MVSIFRMLFKFFLTISVTVSNLPTEVRTVYGLPACIGDQQWRVNLHTIIFLIYDLYLRHDQERWAK